MILSLDRQQLSQNARLLRVRYLIRVRDVGGCNSSRWQKVVSQIAQLERLVPLPCPCARCLQIFNDI